MQKRVPSFAKVLCFIGLFLTVQFLLAPPPQPIKVQNANPCFPSPCGPNSQCRDIGGSPSCSCVPNYIGSPPNCRPECTNSAECPSNQACIREKCRDPCPGSCGALAQCSVISHTPMCVCPDGYTGDPFSSCVPKPPRKFFKRARFLKVSLKFVAPPQPVVVDKCNPNPCGPNSQCNEGICTCLAEYRGDPYQGCRPECVLSEDCDRTKACIRNKCIDPCAGTCGQNAECQVVNHIPMCSCSSGYTGNAFLSCRYVESE